MVSFITPLTGRLLKERGVELWNPHMAFGSKVPKLGLIEAVTGTASPFHCFRRPKEVGVFYSKSLHMFLLKIIATYSIELGTFLSLFSYFI